MTTATAPGKIILVGEHAVVYGRPAIAVPVWERVATATITNGPPNSGCCIAAKDIDRTLLLAQATDDEPLALATRMALAQLDLPANPDWQIDLTSQLPIASGLGSGAALSAALVKAIYAHVGQSISPEQVSRVVYASEQLYHGTPSGIDNTVIAHGTPIWFVKGEAPTAFVPKESFTIVIADSGITAPTKETVGDVRKGWQAKPTHYEAWFDAIGNIVQQTRDAIEMGTVVGLGGLFQQNQSILHQLGVSSAPLERLIDVAQRAGSLGAKLSGGGRGGNIIALVTAETVDAVTSSLTNAGVRQLITTQIGSNQ